MENETSSPNIEILDLDVKSFNALKRAGINTIADIEAQTEQLGSTIPPRQWTNIIKALNAYKGIPIPGSWVEEDMLGEELTFDEIADMVGEIIIMDKSTESHDWYKAVLIEKIVVGENGSRRLIYYDGAKQRGLVDEMYFDKNQRRPDKAWRVKLPVKPSEPPATVQSETPVAASFDYSELDNSIAKSLRDCEAVIRQETAGYFTLLGAKFKEAQDLLANHSSGTFERWYTSMGFKRQTVYNLIQRYEFSSSPTIGGREEAFENLSLTLSYDISKPDAPSALVEQVMNGDITTHKEYIALKNELEEANKKIELAEFHSKQQSESFKRVADASKTNYEKYQEERHKNDDLEKRIRELENRPVEVAVQSDEEALAEKDQEISELKEEIARMSDKNIKSFVIRMSLDDYEEFLNALESNEHSHLKAIMQSAKMIKL